MRMKFILAISSMALLSACGGGGDNGGDKGALSDVDKGADKSALSDVDKGGDTGGKSGLSNIDKEWRAGFVESCTSSAVDTGVPADVSAKACGCTADKVIDQYTLVERAQLDDDSTDKLEPILIQCVEELGLDQE